VSTSVHVVLRNVSHRMHMECRSRSSPSSYAAMIMNDSCA
jgi:hypothetical protein